MTENLKNFHFEVKQIKKYSSNKISPHTFLLELKYFFPHSIYRLRTSFTTGGWQNAFQGKDDIKREPLSEAEDELVLPRRSRHDSNSPPPRR